MEAEEIYTGPDSNPTVTGSEDNLFSWIKDALFSKKESPSKRYLHPRGGVGMQTRTYRPATNTERNHPRVRSNSLDGLTESFYQRYDLLHDEDDSTAPMTNYYNDNLRPRSVDRVASAYDHNSLRSPIDIHPKLNPQQQRSYTRGNENNDTFNKRGNVADAELNYISPKRGDPLLNRLFMTNQNPAPVQFPGKFPTPRKPQGERTANMDTETVSAYNGLLEMLAANNNKLQALNGTITAQQKEQESEEQFLRQQYLRIKEDYSRCLKETGRIITLSEETGRKNKLLMEENEQLRYNNRNAVEFEQQQISVLKNELKQTNTMHQSDKERLLRRIDELRSENNKLTAENRNLRYDLDSRDGAQRRY